MRIGKGTLVRWKKGNEYSQGRVELAYKKAGKAPREDNKKAFLIRQDDGGTVMKMDSEIEVSDS
ncbi:hypothetical protein RCC89_01355 [Cytophagaceae bacterium ABcell3]|nr:hypothetical protein RCC89_01355 [Cytophagaceae bacterium ABcell3]